MDDNTYRRMYLNAATSTDYLTSQKGYTGLYYPAGAQSYMELPGNWPQIFNH